MAARLRIGVLSAAHIATRTVGPAIASSRNAEVVALASRDPSCARAFAAALGGPRVHDSYDAVLADPEVDAIYLPLPTALHREWAIRAAERGKHVLCEKPLALTPDDGRAIEAAALSRRVVVMEAFMYRFHPRTLKLIDLVRNAGGAMRRTRAAFTFVRPRLSVSSRLRQRLGSVRRQLVPPAWWPERVASSIDLGRGVLYGLGSYCVDLGRLMTDEAPVEAQAAASWSRSGVDEHLVGSVRFSSGASLDFECGRAVEAGHYASVEAGGRTFLVERAFLPGKAPTEIVETSAASGSSTVERRHAFEAEDQYRLMVEHFADTVLKGTPPRHLIAEAVANLTVIQSLYESARSGGRPVRIAAVKP